MGKGEQDLMANANYEFRLQQSALVDEKQAVRRWPASWPQLRRIYVLSATRMDIGTLRALGMRSLKMPGWRRGRPALRNTRYCEETGGDPYMEAAAGLTRTGPLKRLSCL